MYIVPCKLHRSILAKVTFKPLQTAPRSTQQKVLPSITISRETGAGAVMIGKLVLDILQKRLRDPMPWALFDRNLVERVISDHALPQRLKQFMPEDKTGRMHSIMEEVLGLHPDPRGRAGRWHTSNTILQLASMGHAIIVGRGGNIITARLPNVLHVRLIAPLEARIRRIRQTHSLTEREAAIYIHNADRGRERYVKHYFNENVADPLHYHMILNTGDLVRYGQAIGGKADES